MTYSWSTLCTLHMSELTKVFLRDYGEKFDKYTL